MNKVFLNSWNFLGNANYNHMIPDVAQNLDFKPFLRTMRNHAYFTTIMQNLPTGGKWVANQWQKIGGNVCMIQ